MTILGGDLNFTLGTNEIWGPRARVDSLEKYFEKLLRDSRLIDISSVKLKSTWTNRRTGDDRIAKRLDHFLLDEKLMEHNFRIK